MTGDGLGRLWAGWRSAYVTGAIEADRRGQPGQLPTAEGIVAELGPGQVEGCVLCRITAPGVPDRDAYVLWRGQHCAAVLNAYPYTSGHLMVMPTRHVPQLEDLTAAESTELWEGTREAVVALEAAFEPGGVNLGANLGRAAGAGVPGHVHLHALPRWDGDTNFMTTVAEVRVLPEPLDVTWSKLRGVWPGGTGGR